LSSAHCICILVCSLSHGEQSRHLLAGVNVGQRLRKVIGDAPQLQLITVYAALCDTHNQIHFRIRQSVFFVLSLLLPPFMKFDKRRGETDDAVRPREPREAQCSKHVMTKAACTHASDGREMDK
jgi:hypothetical protein